MTILVLIACAITCPSPLHAGDSLRVQSPAILRFAGDCLLAEHYDRAVGSEYDYAFRDFSILREADVAMVNLECPVTDRGERQSKPFTFRMKPEFSPALLTAGIDIVNLANNHIYDYGKEGLFDTIEHLDSIGIRHVGAGRTAGEAHQGVVMDIHGIRIGFLGYYGGGEAPAARGTRPGVAHRNIQSITRDIERMKSQDSVDFVVVNFHWGVEKAQYPEASQVKFAHNVIDAGANAVIGHHPHVLQGIERYKDGVIVYSLGNFIFGGNSKSSYSTALFEIRLGRDGAEYAILPIRIDRWRASLLEGVEAEAVVDQMRHLSSRFSRTIFHDKEKQ